MSTPQEQVVTNSDELNKEQKNAFDLMRKGKNVFITGPGGTGKSFTIAKYYEYAVNKYGATRVYKTSSTGVSAILINGKTLHSWAGIYLGKGSASELLSKMKFPIKKRWKRTKVLFIDEISMINPDLFDKLEQIARSLRRTTLPFGGIQLIISGDFFQLPVVKCDRYCFEGLTWDKVINHTITLKKIIRQKDIVFQQMLNEIRYGDISLENSDILHSRIDAPLNNEFGIEPTVLYPKRVQVNRINNKRLNDLLTRETKHVYEAKYQVVYNNSSVPKDSIIQKFQKIDERTLDTSIFCKGTQVVFKFNIDVENGIANGTRGIIVDFQSEVDGGTEYPMVRLLNGTKFLTYPANFEYEIDKEYKLIKTQVPLKLAWASTIHSCQGSTLDYVKADIGENVFECGQAYVALSRVKNLEGLTLTDYDPDAISANPRVLERYGPNASKSPKVIGPLDIAFSKVKGLDLVVDTEIPEESMFD